MTLKRLLMTLGAILAVALLSVGTAAADTIATTPVSYTGTTDLTDLVLYLPQWDPAAYVGFTLTKVTVDFTVSENVNNVTITNTGENEQIFELDLTSKVSPGGAGDPLLFSPIMLNLATVTGLDLQAAGGTTCSGPGAPTATCSQYSFTPGVSNGSGQVAVTDSSLFTPYIGSGTFTLTTSTKGATTIIGGSNLTADVSNTATITAQVTYDYDNATPEPASMFLSGGALLALGALLRKRKA